MSDSKPKERPAADETESKPHKVDEKVQEEAAKERAESAGLRLRDQPQQPIQPVGFGGGLVGTEAVDAGEA